ncbi:MAG: glycosyltransferase family 4 protein [Anaerolineales bacterium]
MRILYLSQYFPPEAGATQTRAYEMARNLVRLGHQVSMLAEIPNHPAGVIFPKYRGKLIDRSDLDGIDVIRVWVKTSPVKNFTSRMLFYLSFMLNATLAGLLVARGHYDLIYASSPPLFVGGAALALSALRRIPLVFEVRDLWPEIAIALGELSQPAAIRWATRLERACYRRARAIVVVTQGDRQRLLERGLPSQKLIHIPNGANLELFQERPAGRSRIRRELGLDGKFVAIYAGIHGLAQGLETLVEAARHLADHPNIQLLLVGEGPRKATIQRLVEEYELENVHMLPEQPRERIPDYISAADVALIPLKNLAFFKGTIPSKLFDSWACRRPVILSVDGEARRIVAAAGGGMYVEPENPRALAETLLEMERAPDRLREMGANGRRYTEKYYSRRALAHKLERALQKLDLTGF